MPVTIRGGRVALPGGEIMDMDVVTDRGTIVAVVQPGAPAATTTEIDAAGLLVTPGFVDCHVHGALGSNFMHGTPEAVDAIGEFLVAHGVTSAVAATASVPPAKLLESLTSLRRLVGRRPTGIDLLGIHLEGPFIGERFRGVHRLDAVRDPDQGEVGDLLDAIGDVLRIVTIAPERPGAIAAIRAFAARGIVPSIGHSGASPRLARVAIDAGARRGTHVFNAMPEPISGDDSLIEVLLGDDRIAIEIIADGHHVEPSRVVATHRRVGNRMAVVSDGTDVTGLAPGRHTRWEGTTVILSAGESRTPDGTLAGSVTPLDVALRNLVAFGVDLPDAVAAVTAGPADSVGAVHKGRIAVGADADLVLLDAGLAVRHTISAGSLVHSAPGA